jgi:hypothetical protein
MTQIQLQLREKTLQSKEFNDWYMSIPIVRRITEKKRVIREQIINNQIHNYRQKMANVSEIQTFFNANHGRKGKMLKDINFFDMSLFRNEILLIDKADKDLVQNFAFKLSANQKITEYIMILNNE